MVKPFRPILIALWALALPVWGQTECQKIDYCPEVLRLLPIAEQLRGISYPSPLSCETVDGATYRKISQQLTSEANDAQALENEGRALKILGMIPESYAYAHCMIEGAVDASSALYDRSRKRIVLRNDSGLRASLAVHELTHLLQDHKFHTALMDRLATSTDSSLAIAALREGDAMLSETRAELTSQEVFHPECGALHGSGYSAVCDPPLVLSRILMFPYSWGLRFASVLFKSHGLAILDQAFSHPPLSSRAVLYPLESLQAERRSQRVDLPIARIPGGYRVVYQDTLGEFILRSLMREYAGLAIAGRAAKGWTADRITLSHSLSHGRTRWQLEWNIAVETELDVAELTLGLRRYVEQRFGEKIDAAASRWITTRGAVQTHFVSDRTQRRVKLIIELSEDEQGI